MSAFCAAAGAKYNELATYLLMRRREDGLWGYRTRPTFPFIRRLRHIIHPDLWFIFPDELAEPHGLTSVAVIALAKQYGAALDAEPLPVADERRVSLRLKTSVLDWIGDDYQTKIAAILEDAMKKKKKQK